MSKKIVIAIVLVLVLAGGAFALTRDSNTGAKTESKTAADNTGSKNKQDDTSKKNEDGTPEVTPGSASPGEDGAKVSIANLSQDDQFVYVRTVIQGTATGNCTLQFQKSGAPTVTKTAPIVPVTSYSACNGFNVPKSELASKGDWAFTVKIDGSRAEAKGSIDVK